MFTIKDNYSPAGKFSEAARDAARLDGLNVVAGLLG